MSFSFSTLVKIINNGKNLYKIFFFLVVFLCVVKLPLIFTSDIQPWDEGMYATRVLSIHLNGDFIDQSTHSVGNFYSASHPPLLIWIGYFFTLLFGINSIALKLLIFIFSILCILLILLIGRNISNNRVGFLAALIFCSNIIFTVFSQRFQFDIPYTFFILMSFYLILLYEDTQKYRYLLLCGVSFGCCLMTKILVGFYIPMILFISYFFIKGKIDLKIKDILIITIVGVLIALPWHLYMFDKYGSEFVDYFFKFHIYERAFYGVEMNEKNSGVLYHINYLLTIIPYSILVFISCLKDFQDRKNLNWKKVFLWIWFLTGLVILTVFKTKLEVYVLLILAPASFLIAMFVDEMNKENVLSKTLIIILTFFNILWFATESMRPSIKKYFLQSNITLFAFAIITAVFLLFLLSRYLANRIELKKTYYIFILIFFISINVYYLFFTPEWVNEFNLSEIKAYAESSGRKKIIYIGSNYRYNPQFSYYFSGLNLNWENPEFEFEIVDTKNGYEEIKKKLNDLNGNKYLVIVEKDNINRADYPSSVLFIPEEDRLVLKKKGYELYEN